MPIIITPTGPVPRHMVTIPITRDRVAGGSRFLLARGTGSSNPSPSSGESATNPAAAGELWVVEARNADRIDLRFLLARTAELERLRSQIEAALKESEK
jgi:hypothetical protein